MCKLKNSGPGIQTKIFSQEQAGPRKQNDWEPSPNKGAQDSVENSTHFNTIANLLIVEVRDAQNLYSLIIYHYKQYLESVE